MGVEGRDAVTFPSHQCLSLVKGWLLPLGSGVLGWEPQACWWRLPALPAAGSRHSSMDLWIPGVEPPFVGRPFVFWCISDWSHPVHLLLHAPFSKGQLWSELHLNWEHTEQFVPQLVPLLLRIPTILWGGEGGEFCDLPGNRSLSQ